MAIARNYTESQLNEK